MINRDSPLSGGTTLRFIVICLLVCLMLVGAVSAVTFSTFTPTPTIKLYNIPTTTPTPAPGTLQIHKNAVYGDLYVDNLLITNASGRTDISLSKNPGWFTIVQQNPVFLSGSDVYPATESSVSKTVQVNSGQTTSVTLTAHAMGKIYINSLNPTGGVLTINNQISDPRNNIWAFGPPGMNMVSYTKTGYTPYSTTINLHELETVRLDITLQPIAAFAAPADPTIVSNKPVVVQGHSFSLTITSTPSTDYYLYTTNVPLAPGTSYPLIRASQVSVDISNNTRLLIATQISNSRSFANYPGTVAKIRTSTLGLRTVEFSTGTSTDTGTGGKYFTYELYDPNDPLSSGQVAVRVDPLVDANFVASPLSGENPLTIQFTDTSTGNPDTWSWNFGDGTAAATTRNPVHTYGNPGTYSLTLTASSGVAGTSTESRENYIVVTNPGSNPAAPVPAPAGISPATGALVITSTPVGAGVFLENKVMGVTPLTISDINPGTYSLKLVMTGFSDYSTMVTVNAGQSTEINADLATPRQQPTTQQPVTSQPTGTGPATNSPASSGAGSLSVTTIPPGAKFYIDDVMGGVTPATIPGLAAGPHTIRLVMDGYEEIVVTVTIIPDQTQEYRTSLSPETTLPGGVNIPGLNKVPGFESGLALAGLCISGVVRWIFYKDQIKQDQMT
jgi:hypothetical protein